MGELNIQIKVLKRSSPVLFSWWNKEIGATEGCLVVCPCQDLDLSEGSRSSKRGKKKRRQQEAIFGSWFVKLGEALERAEILTIPVETESGSILTHRNTNGRPEGECQEHLEGLEVGASAQRTSEAVAANALERIFSGDHPAVTRTGDPLIKGKDEHRGDHIQGKRGRPTEENNWTPPSIWHCEESSQAGSGMPDGESRGSMKPGEDVDGVETGGTSPQGSIVRGRGVTDASEAAQSSSQENQNENQASCDGWQKGMPDALTGAEEHGKTLHISDVGEVGDSESVIANEEGVCSDVDSTGPKKVIDDQVTGTLNVSGDSQLAGLSTFSVSSHLLPQGKVFTNSVGSQVVPTDGDSTGSVVVLQDGQELSAEVDKALLKALEGLLKPQTEPPLQKTEETELNGSQECSQHIKNTELTAVVDPVYAINTPAMVNYREHQTRLYLEKLHRVSEGSGSKNMTICEVCGSIISVRQLRRHMRYVHSAVRREKIHKCETCGKRFYESASLVRHKRMHLDRPTFQCGECNKSFRHHSQLHNHKKSHAGLEPPKRVYKPRYRTSNPKPRKGPAGDGSGSDPGVAECPVCKTKIGAKSLRRHLKMKHSKVPERLFGCTECDAKFPRESSLQTHTLTHKGLKFYCGFCKLVLSEDFERVKHERTHACDQTGVKFKCGFCPKAYSREHDRLRHEKGHFDPTVDLSHGTRNRICPRLNEPVQCPLCNKTLKQKSMKSHMDSHIGKTWTCGICGKTISKGAQYEHLKLHSGMRHFCNICASSFVTKQTLAIHLRTHSREKVVPCRFCERKFANYTGRNNHERDHTGERPYQCEKCEKAWKDRSTYTQHMKKHHPGEPLMTRKRAGGALLARLPGVPIDGITAVGVDHTDDRLGGSNLQCSSTQGLPDLPPELSRS